MIATTLGACGRAPRARRHTPRLTCRTLLLGALLAPGLLAPDTLLAQGFASSVVVSGDEVLIAESRGGDDDSGVVYVYAVYARNGDDWIEAYRITHPTPSEGAGFGSTMAISGDQLLIGALNQRSPEDTKVLVYSKASGQWRHDGEIVAEDLPEGMILGMAVAMDGDAAAITAGSPQSGASVVVVFRAADGGWVQEDMLEYTGASAPSAFGAVLAMDAGMLVVGAPLADSVGKAYVYEDGADGWAMTGELTGSSGGVSGLFGASAAIMADRLLVGAVGEQGTVVAFTRGDGEWTESGHLAAFDGAFGDGFGSTLATDGENLWVGAPGVQGRRGAIYEFTNPDAIGWTAVAKIMGPNPEVGAQLGTIVAVGEAVLVSGMPRDDYGLGSALMFARTDDGWSEGYSIFSEVEGYAEVLGEEVPCAEGEASVFGCSDVDLVSFVPVEDLGGGRGVRVNDVWGWSDTVNGRDYAIVGRMDGTSFVDVTDPVNPVVVGNLPKPESVHGSSWRDMKVYKDHVFVVADGVADHGMQIFDLTRLRDFDGTMLTFDPDAHYDLLHSVHNIVINEETGFAYAVGSSGGGNTCGGGLHMINIGDPQNPTFAGCFAHENTGRRGTGYSHDAQCVVYQGPDEEHAGQEICFGSNETALSISDVSDKDNPIVLGLATYPNAVYTHQGWLTDDHAYFYMNDELDEVRGVTEHTRTLIWDVRDLDEPILLKEHLTDNRSSDHNLYIKGDLMYQSNYNSGLRVFDISDVENPREVAFFDTVPGEDFPAMDGSWSNYPFFESGIVLVTSMDQGLFLVRKRDRTPVS